MKPIRQQATRAEIAKRVRTLRELRGFTQRELAERLGMSQGRYSVVERGEGSFSAEQFVEILRVFNVTVGEIVQEKVDPGAVLHKALARLGATHLIEDSRLLPSEQLVEVESALKEVLIVGEPARQVTALAPVLIRNIEHLNLSKLWVAFKQLGLERRFAWLLDSTLDAAVTELGVPGLSRGGARSLKKTKGALDLFLRRGGPQGIRRPDAGGVDLAKWALDVDVVGPQVTSEKTLLEIIQSSSTIAQRWGIATAIQPHDFIEAVRAACVKAD